jgi:hypothetical protein
LIQNDSTKAAFYVEIDSIPSLTGTDIYIYYNNSQANTTSNGTATFDWYDPIDDISTTSVDTAGGNGGINFVSDTSICKHNSACFNNDDADDNYKTEMQNDMSFDVDNYITEGWLYIGPDESGNEEFGPGIQVAASAGSNTGYTAIIDERSDTSPQVRRDTSNNQRTDGDYQVSLETWYLVNIYRDDNTNVKSELYTESQVYGTQPQTTTSRPDTLRNSGYTGFFVYSYDNSYVDAIWTRKRTEDTPTYGEWGQEEIGGPSIQNPNINASTINRNDNIEISANITSNKAVDTVWLTMTLPNSTSQNLSMDNISSLYTLTYQSLEIGEYSAVIYANDTDGITTNSPTLSWTTYGFANLTESNLTSINIFQGDITNMLCIS